MGFQLVTDSAYELLRVQVFWVSLLGIWLIYGLFAFWICSKKLHWFIQFCCFAGSAALLMCIEAPVLMQVVLSYSLTIWSAKSIFQSNAIGRLLRLRLGPDEKGGNAFFQIGLADSLWAVFAFAILLVIARIELSEPFSLLYAVAYGIALGVTSVFAHWLALTQRNSSFILVIGIVASIAGAFCAYRFIFPPPENTGLFTTIFSAILGSSFVWGELSDFAIAILICNAIAIYLLATLSNWNSSPNPRFKRVARSLWWLSVIAIIGLSIATVDVGRQLIRRYEVDWHVLPKNEVNGFDELVTAGKRFGESTMLCDPGSAIGGPTLAAELEIYAAEFRLVETALERPTLTAALKNGEDFLSTLIDEIKYTRSIARALTSRAKQHLHAGEPDRALQDSCRIVEIRVPLSRAKTIVSELVAVAIESMGHLSNFECISAASPAALRDGIERVTAVDNENTPFEEIYQNDCVANWECQNWLGHLRRQIITLMALELFRREHDGHPTRLSELVPNYLPSIPQDPFTVDQPLSYRLSETKDTFQLYSIGPDGKDDDGKLGPEGVTIDTGDINIRANIQYQKATTDAERQSLSLLYPWEEQVKEPTPE